MKFDKRFQSLSGKELASFIGVFIFVIIGVVLSRTHPDFFINVYVVEDGFIEWLTALALLSGAIVCFYRFFILKPFRPKLFQVCLILLGLLYFFGFLEEISYGQRIFGFSTPEMIGQYNTQGEFNLHNLELFGFRLNKLIFGLFLGILIAVYFLIMPILYRKVEQVKLWVDRLAIPIPKWFHVFSYIVLFLLVETIPSEAKGEILEFGGACIFLIMTVRPFNREIFSRRSLSY